MGRTMDMAIVRETFTRTLQAAEMLGLDESLQAELKDKLPRLLPYQIGARGQLQEWMYDFKEWEPKHRHFSHLYGLHPGNQITADGTPDLFDAVKQTLILRGDEATGWSMGWKINCWARLQDETMLIKLFQTYLTRSVLVMDVKEAACLRICWMLILLSRSTVTSDIQPV